MAEHDPKTPAGRIAIAVDGRNPKAVADVRGSDLAAVCATVPEDEADDVTRSLALGAANALKGLTPGATRRLMIGATVASLNHLLEIAPAA